MKDSAQQTHRARVYPTTSSLFHWCAVFVSTGAACAVLTACDQQESPSEQKARERQELLTAYRNAIRFARDYRHCRFDRFYGKNIQGERRNGDTISYFIFDQQHGPGFSGRYWSKSRRLQSELFTNMLNLRHDTSEMQKLRQLYPGENDTAAVRHWLRDADSLVNQFQPIALRYGFYSAGSRGPWISFHSPGGDLLYTPSDSASVQACADLMNSERSHTSGFGGAWSSVWTFCRLNEHFTFYYNRDTLDLGE